MSYYEDDPRFAKLAKENPGFPVEFLAMLYRLDRRIEEIEAFHRETMWLRETANRDLQRLEDKSFEFLDKTYGEEDT